MTTKFTPLMEQYFEIKKTYSDAILLFQVGDFYELFFEDAKIVSSFLGITLTKRGKNNGQDIPLCGVPVHALNHYLVKLVKGGFKVAICDQVTKPVPGTVVSRKVTQVLTPATLTDSALLDEKSASYLLTFVPGQDNWGLIFTEVLTAQIYATTLSAGSFKQVETELIRFFPDEIILPDSKFAKGLSSFFKTQGYVVSFVENNYQEDKYLEVKFWIEKNFSSNIIEKLNNNLAIQDCIQALYFYLKKNQQASLDSLKNINFYKSEDFLILDSATQKNLEILKNCFDGSGKNSLLSVLDKAKTSMGSRNIKKWLSRPLVSIDSIRARQEVISFFVKNINLVQKLEEILSDICDIERVVGRIALNRATLQDYLALKYTLFLMPELKKILNSVFGLALINLIQDKILDFAVLVNLLNSSLNEDINFSWKIKKGFDQELDRLRELVTNGQQEILKLESQEIELTGINSLKIRYNNISGYYIEITNPNLHLVPERYIEQQKLVNRKRFVTKELKSLEAELLRAENEIEEIENQVFERVKKEVFLYLSNLRQLANALAILDSLYSFSSVAYQNNYVCPNFNLNRDVIIKEGRHPVVELSLNFSFEPNNTDLTDSQSLLIITGPNMGGKSTYLRQVALISIMAQTGSFVPASFADLPIIDRIFTRIGSGDNLAEGKSTFLVEMEEVAVICRQATKNSLVILDEVGRGTSTFDGIALAQAIIEYIYLNVGARTLFATHYHELTELENIFDGVKNYYMISQKTGDRVVFLHRIERGVAGASFGLEVAKLANLPGSLVSRAKVILDNIHGSYAKFVPAKQDMVENKDFSASENKNNQVLSSLKDLNLDIMSPKQVYDFIWEIKEKLG